ncbi:MAG: pseudouridine synthase [Spirochaetota bacterium]
MTRTKIRINKYLSLCGLGSRRKTEEIIRKGHIYVNGIPMTNLSYLVNIDNDIVMYRGQVLLPVETYHYLMLNKPKGYVTTTKDERNRPTVLHLIPESYKLEGTFPVGRLDKDTEGLLLFTNDGELAYKLTHPRFKVPKTYQVMLDRPLRDDHTITIEHGIELYGSQTLPATITPVNDEWTIVTITITQGKKRQVRMMFSTLGYEVIGLIRIQYGPIRLGNLPTGKYRVLSKQEIEKLKSAVN